MRSHAPPHSPWSEKCGCGLSPSCDVHRAAVDRGAALQAAVLPLSARMHSQIELEDYFSHDHIGREIAAALHEAGLLLPEMPSSARRSAPHTAELVSREAPSPYRPLDVKT